MEDKRKPNSEEEVTSDVAGEGNSTCPFLKPRLTGVRFEGHSIPLEFLKDLAVLEKMVIDVAKWRYLQDHKDRKRSPRGFTDGVSLMLTDIEGGSVTPVISLVMAGATLFPPPNQTYFLEARDAIVQAIRAAEQKTSILDHFPERALSYFDSFGQSLRDGEAIELSINGDTRASILTARLTKATRRQLVLASTQVQNVTEEVTTKGVVPEADQADMTFEIQLKEGRKIQAPMSDPHTEAILEAFNGYKRGLRIVLQGIGITSRTGLLEKIESVDQIDVLDPLDVASRLDEFRSLDDGWLEGSGKAPSAKGLDWFSAEFDKHYPDDLPLPYLYPTAEGGVRAEWSLANIEASIEIDLETKNGEWHSLDLTTDDDDSHTLNLDENAGWSWFVGRIKKGAE